MYTDDGKVSAPLTGIENGLAMVLLATVWLVPNHQLPWSSFHHELVIAVALLLMCCLVGWQTKWKFPLTAVSAFVLVLVWLPWIQWAMGLIPKSGTAFISSAYLAAIFLAVVLGQAGVRMQNLRLFHILFGALILSSALNVIVQLFQWYQWQPDRIDSLLMILVTPVTDGQRPSGMLLQPNQLATLQVWGLIGLSWFRYQKMIRLPLFIALFVLICLGIGLTRSRTGLLEVLLITILLGWGLWQNSYCRDLIITWCVAFILLIALELNFVQVADWMGASSLTVPSRLAGDDGARLHAWRIFVSAIVERPWMGYGLADLGYAFVATAELRPELYFGARFVHAHNAVLDLLLWVGLPLGTGILIVLIYWIFRRFGELKNLPVNIFPFAMILSLGVHSMLELPHHFLYFLVPAGLAMGMLSARSEPAMNWALLPRWTWLIAGIAVFISISTVVRDYFPYQDRYTEWRYENQRVGTRPDVVVHEPLILNQLHDEIMLYRLPLGPDLTATQLEWISETSRSVSSPQAFYVAAKAFAFTGNSSQAHSWMLKFNAVMTAQKVEIMQEVWEGDQLRYPELARYRWPSYQGQIRN